MAERSHEPGDLGNVAMKYIYCPVCDFWWADSGYTMRTLKDMEKHIAREHRDYQRATGNGGLLDRWLSSKLAEEWRS